MTLNLYGQWGGLVCTCLLICLTQTACSENPDYNVELTATPTALANDITAFRDDFDVMISDVSRELDVLQKELVADATGTEAAGARSAAEADEADTVATPDSSETPVAAGAKADTSASPASATAVAAKAEAKADSITRVHTQEELHANNSQKPCLNWTPKQIPAIWNHG